LLRTRRRLELWLGGPAILTAVFVLVGLILVGAVLVYAFERSRNEHVVSMISGIRWVAVAMVQGPPWEPVTTGGKVIAYAIGLIKPASVGIILAAMTSKMVHWVQGKGSGTGRARLRDHIVICGWSSKGAEILKEIRGRGDDESRRPVVVLAPLSANPTRDELTTFVSGDPTEAKDLIRAGLREARTAIVLADNSYPDIDVEEMDSRTLLTTLAIESVNPNCYTCVEVIHSKNREHFNRTKADELVVSAHLTGALLAHSAVTHGLSRVVEDLITYPVGDEFYWVTVPAQMAGLTFREALLRLKEQQDCLAIAVAKDGQYMTNPDSGLTLESGDRLLVISKEEPFDSTHRRRR
jgi:voltage-gated potassium channel